MENFQCGCYQTSLPREPRPQKSKFIQDISASIAIRARENSGGENIRAHYSYLVELRRPLDDKNYIEAQFSDPKEGNEYSYRVPMLPIKDDDQKASTDVKSSGRR